MNLTGVPSAGGEMPSAMSNLGLANSETPEEMRQRKKRLMAAAGNDSAMSRYGDTAFAMLGLNPTAS